MDTRKTEVKEIVKPNKYEIELTFDNDRLMLISKKNRRWRGLRRSCKSKSSIVKFIRTYVYQLKVLEYFKVIFSS